MCLSGQLRDLQGRWSGSNRDKLGLGGITPTVRRGAPTPLWPVERRKWHDQKALWSAHRFRATGARDVYHRQTGNCPPRRFLAIHLYETFRRSTPAAAIDTRRTKAAATWWVCYISPIK